MMSSKNCYSRPSLNKGSSNKGYDLIISVCDVNNKILLLDSNYIADVVP